MNWQPRVYKVLVAWQSDHWWFQIRGDGLWLVPPPIFERLAASKNLTAPPPKRLIVNRKKALKCVKQMLEDRLIESIDAKTFQITDQNNGNGEGAVRDAISITKSVTHDPFTFQTLPTLHPWSNRPKVSVKNRTEGEMLNLAYRLSHDDCDVDDLKNELAFVVNEPVEKVVTLLRRYGFVVTDNEIRSYDPKKATKQK